MTEQEWIDITDLAKIRCALSSLRWVHPGNKHIKEAQELLYLRIVELERITDEVIDMDD